MTTVYSIEIADWKNVLLQSSKSKKEEMKSQSVIETVDILNGTKEKQSEIQISIVISIK